jgi:hypothetical protein
LTGFKTMSSCGRSRSARSAWQSTQSASAWTERAIRLVSTKREMTFPAALVLTISRSVWQSRQSLFDGAAHVADAEANATAATHVATGRHPNT